MGKSIKLISQAEGSYCCGQCCVAMVAGVSLEEAKKAIGKNGCTSTKTLQRGLIALNMRPRGGKLKAIYGDLSKLPETGILKTVAPWRRSGWHWALKHKGKIYCPSDGLFTVAEYGRIAGWNITSYLEIFMDGRSWQNPKCKKKIGPNFSPETECPDRLLIHRENSRIMSVDCNKTCPHHISYVDTRIQAGPTHGGGSDDLIPQKGHVVAEHGGFGTIGVDCPACGCHTKFDVDTGCEEPNFRAVRYVCHRGVTSIVKTRLAAAKVGQGPWPTLMCNTKKRRVLMDLKEIDKNGKRA